MYTNLADGSATIPMDEFGPDWLWNDVGIPLLETVNPETSFRAVKYINTDDAGTHVPS
jgi:hypothetical protein